MGPVELLWVQTHFQSNRYHFLTRFSGVSSTFRRKEEKRRIDPALRVELMGVEPTTSRVRFWRSPS